MLNTLEQWLRAGDGETRVALRLCNASGYSPYILRAADQLGIIVSPSERPEEMIAYPWPSVFGLNNRKD